MPFEYGDTVVYRPARGPIVSRPMIFLREITSTISAVFFGTREEYENVCPVAISRGLRHNTVSNQVGYRFTDELQAVGNPN